MSRYYSFIANCTNLSHYLHLLQGLSKPLKHYNVIMRNGLWQAFYFCAKAFQIISGCTIDEIIIK
jgi:hypothetical protein